MLEGHAGDASHEVELGRPHEPEASYGLPEAPVGAAAEVTRAEELSMREVGVLVDADVVVAHSKRNGDFADRELTQAGNAVLDHESSPGTEVTSGILEASDLFVLSGEIADGVEDEIDEREVAVDPRCGHVTFDGGY